MSAGAPARSTAAQAEAEPSPFWLLIWAKLEDLGLVPRHARLKRASSVRRSRLERAAGVLNPDEAGPEPSAQCGSVGKQQRKQQHEQGQQDGHECGRNRRLVVRTSRLSTPPLVAERMRWLRPRRVSRARRVRRDGHGWMPPRRRDLMGVGGSPPKTAISRRQGGAAGVARARVKATAGAARGLRAAMDGRTIRTATVRS